MFQLVPNSEKPPIALNVTARTAMPPAARLLIHAEDKFRARESRRSSKLWWLRRMYSDGQINRAPLCLQIADLQGKRLLVVDDAGPLTEVSLPAGAYQVTAQLGEVRRGYTLTLAQGALFDLYLRLAPDQH